MLHELLISLLVSLGIMNPKIEVHTAFTLFQEGHYKEACELINASKYYDVKKAKDEHEYTLLIAAVHHADTLDATHTPKEKKEGIEQTIDTILKKVDFDKYYVTSRDVHWQTVFTHAVQKGYQDIAAYLYMFGADPRIKDIYGKTARDYVEDKAFRQILLGYEWETYEMLKDPHNLWRNLRNGSFSMVSNLLKYMQEEQLFSLRDQLGNTIVHGLIMYSCALPYDMQLEHKERYILTLLNDVYEATNNKQAFSELIDVPNNLGHTAYMWALKFGYKELLEWLNCISGSAFA
ncbi:MAG: hypothetical protein AB7F19_02095 [Candidatus Babeliales bacterium]